MRSLLLTGLFLCTPLIAAEPPQPKPAYQLPKEILAVLQNAEKVEVFSLLNLDTERGEDAEKYKDAKEKFHGVTVIGKTTLGEKATREKLVNTVTKGIHSDDPGELGRCFDPHHGVRAKSGDTTVELLICYQCWTVVVFVDGKRQFSVATRRDPRDTFNAILRDAKVPLAKKALGDDKEK